VSVQSTCPLYYHFSGKFVRELKNLAGESQGNYNVWKIAEVKPC